MCFPHPQPPASLHKFHRLVDTSTSSPKPPAIMASPAIRKSRMPPHLTLLDFSSKFSQWQHFSTITDFINILIPHGNRLSIPHIPLNLLSEVTSGPSVANSNPLASASLTSSFSFYFFVCMSLPFLFVSFLFIYLFLFIYFFAAPLSPWYFPDQGSNLCPLHWKHRVLTTGPPGKSWPLPF